MLDTVALTLESDQFTIRDPGRFSPSAQGLLSAPYYALGGRGNFACVQNPTKTDFEEGRYLPRLTLNRRFVRGGFSLTLRVEFSAPKLVFGNNFDELTSRDFERVLIALRRGLGQMGVTVADPDLRAARVSAIHFSKNIALLDFTTCAMILDELSKADLDRRLDLARTDYRNAGQAIRYHSNSYEIAFYDKLKDLAQTRISPKRSVEADRAPQLGLFDAVSSFPKQLEVLRMEVRLGNRARIRKVLKQIGADSDRELTFAGLFDTSLSKSVLLHFWAAIQSRLPPMGGMRASRPEDLMSVIAAQMVRPLRPGALLQQVGGLLLLESIGARGLGALMTRHCSTRSWQRHKRQLGEIGRFIAPSGRRDADRVDAALREFRPLRIADFQGTSSASSIVVSRWRKRSDGGSS